MDFGKGASRSTSHTALIEVKGMIADTEQASADNIVGSLRAAFEDEKTKGVILRINSPGGSPVQSGYIYDEIRRLRAKKPDIKVYAVITDLGASGAYYIASAADQIYADKASLVGSIGVTAAGFGFVGTMEKLGVDRRTYTSGEHKAFLDPFQPPKPDETAFWQGVLDTTHNQFIASVKAGRGDRLKDKDHPELFSGLVWTGEQAVGLGLKWSITRCKSPRSIASRRRWVPVSPSRLQCGQASKGRPCADPLSIRPASESPAIGRVFRVRSGQLDAFAHQHVHQAY
jgi:protease-4